LKFKDFERVAQEAFEAVPEQFREGVDGLVVSRESLPHPRLRDVYTLGHCDTESFPSDWVGPETTRSVVVLYYGSFRNLARLDPEFDWDAEIHETVQHEVRHHLESLADEDQRGGVDYAMDEDFKRDEGDDFDPWYYQHGESAGSGVYQYTWWKIGCFWSRAGPPRTSTGPKRSGFAGTAEATGSPAPTSWGTSISCCSTTWSTRRRFSSWCWCAAAPGGKT
jgi:predicted Zn-dependent protease with MMP-like domain